MNRIMKFGKKYWIEFLFVIPIFQVLKPQAVLAVVVWCE